MKCTYKFMIYDVTKEKMFDYCQSSFNKVLDWAEAEKLKDNQDIETSNPYVYTKSKFDLLRACAPDEVQMKEMMDDIVQYYQKYFAMEDSAEDEKEIEICINCHKYAKYEYGSSAGSTIDIWYFSIINALFAQANIYGQKYNLHQIVSHNLICHCSSMQFGNHRRKCVYRSARNRCLLSPIGERVHGRVGWDLLYSPDH